MTIPTSWFNFAPESNTKSHPLKRMAWYLQDHAEEIPAPVMDEIVSYLGEIEQELVQADTREEETEVKSEQINKDNLTNDKLFKKAYHNVITGTPLEREILFATPDPDSLLQFFNRVKEEMKSIKEKKNAIRQKKVSKAKKKPDVAKMKKKPTKQAK